MSFKALLFILYFLFPIMTHASSSLIINEIMYNPEGSDTKHEWIELKNIGPSPIDIKDWRINDGTNHQLKNDAHPEYFSILPNEYVVLASDITTFLNEHPGFKEKIFDTVLSLKNTGDHIILLDNNKAIVDDITYQPSSGGDGGGKTLERAPDATNVFHESSQIGGTPGKENNPNTPPQTQILIIGSSTSTQPPSVNILEVELPTPSSPLQSGIIISEFLPNPSKDKEEWIELYNTNTASTTLTGWRLKDNSSREYFIKDLVLAPNSFFTIFQRDSKIYINNSGDELSLLNQRGDLVSKIMFQGKAPQNRSFARKGENDWTWTTKPTPGKTNIIISPPPSKNQIQKELAYLNSTPKETEQSSQSFFPNKISTPLLSTLIGLMFTVITILFIKKFL
ncbi:MAG: lamin tail domain-containing protein [Parcubacteria group bacterium]|nr:lamin tail domain-containing protein [Parcubacteria group bacterium]